MRLPFHLLLFLALGYAITSHAHADSPDAKVEQVRGADTFQARADALEAKVEKAGERYAFRDYAGVVTALKGLDKEIDALAAQYPKKKAELMPGVLKTAVYALLAGSYKKQNELQESGRYEALFKKQFGDLLKSKEHDVDVDDFLRHVVRRKGPKRELRIEPVDPEIRLESLERIRARLRSGSGLSEAETGQAEKATRRRPQTDDSGAGPREKDE